MPNPTLAPRLLLAAAGLCGALGVAAAARASHAGDDPWPRRSAAAV